jgi:hypothetical protein
LRGREYDADAVAVARLRQRDARRPGAGAAARQLSEVTAFHKHILAFSGSASTSGNAISMEGSANKWEGIVLAPNGKVSVSGTNSTSAAGAIIAKRISSTNSEAAWSLPE